MKCLAEECSRDAVCRSLCDRHYRRLLSRGDYSDRGSKTVNSGTDQERFHKKYKKSDSTDCWLWVAGTAVNSRGTKYGKHSIDGGKAVGAHRYSYQIFFGEIPAGKYVCHRCDTPLCVNPNHLFIGSHKDNMGDMVNKGRSFKGRGEDKKGRSSLTNMQAAEVLMSNGTYTEIAKRFFVSVSVVARIKRGESYF
jgi:hypothetical protein